MLLQDASCHNRNTGQPSAAHRPRLCPRGAVQPCCVETQRRSGWNAATERRRQVASGAILHLLQAGRSEPTCVCTGVKRCWRFEVAVEGSWGSCERWGFDEAQVGKETFCVYVSSGFFRVASSLMRMCWSVPRRVFQDWNISARTMLQFQSVTTCWEHGQGVKSLCELQPLFLQARLTAEPLSLCWGKEKSKQKENIRGINRDI